MLYQLTLLNKTISPDMPWIAIRGFKGDDHNSQLVLKLWIEWAISIGKHGHVKIEISKGE